MKSLKQLEKEMSELKSFQANARHSIMKDIELVVRRKLTRSKAFKKMLADLEASRELTNVEHDEYFHRWIRADFSQFIDVDSELQREAFQSCLDSMDTFAIADFKNDSLSTAEGPCITINWSPDRRDYFVYDQDERKQVVAEDDCLDENGDVDESKVYEAIETWMEKHGHFPSVVSISPYDGSPIGYVNTQPSLKVGAK